jgi:hypothetical protein
MISSRRKRMTQRMKRGLFGRSAGLPVIAIAGLAAASVLTRVGRARGGCSPGFCRLGLAVGEHTSQLG